MKKGERKYIDHRVNVLQECALSFWVAEAKTEKNE